MLPVFVKGGIWKPSLFGGFAVAIAVAVAAGIVMVFAAVKIFAAEPAGMGKLRPEAVPAAFPIEAAGAVPVTAEAAGNTAGFLFAGDPGAAALVIAALGRFGKRRKGAATTGISGRGTVGSAGRIAEAVLHILT